MKATSRRRRRFSHTEQHESAIRSPETKNCLNSVAFRREPHTPENQRGAFTPSKQPKQWLTTCPEEEQAGVMDLLPLSPNDVKFFFTLFSKCFSSFVHTTCSLSVSVQYLAFAEVHLRVCTALSNCTTLGTEEYSDHVRSLDKNGTIALHGETFQNASSNDHWSALPSLHYNSTTSDSFHRGFKHRLYPFHSPLLRVSQLFSFPPLNDMLKFSGLSCAAEVERKKTIANKVLSDCEGLAAQLLAR